MMSLARVSGENGIEVHLIGAEGWDDFEAVAKWLEKSCDAVVVDRLDGICTRTWKFEIQGEEVTLKHHDDIGDYLVCRTETEAIRDMLGDLER
jgi:hypothetical protein